MTLDPRCCGSGTCIVDTAGRCWCGQQWDGERMCNPGPAVHPSPDPESADGSKAPTQDKVINRVGATDHLLALWSTPATRPGRRTGLGRRCLSLGLGFAALWALILPLPASAAEVGDADARAVKTVIEAQLASLTSGNAERAFSYASAAIRLQFGDAAKFMSMVQTSYPMLLQRAATSYFVPELADGAVLQKLQLRDRAGRLWLVTYQLQQQPDAAWRVNGCAVRPADDKASI